MSKYVLDIERSEYFNDYSKRMEDMSGIPAYESKEKRKYKRWEDLMGFFFQWRIEHDFCSGHNFIEDEKTITRMDYDEGGYTFTTLHKWKTFDEDVHFIYTVQLNGREAVTVEGTADLMEWLKEETGDEHVYIHWKDDSAGRIGFAMSEEHEDYGAISRKVCFRNTEYLQQCQEHWEELRKEKEEEEKKAKDPEGKQELPF